MKRVMVRLLRWASIVLLAVCSPQFPRAFEDLVVGMPNPGLAYFDVVQRQQELLSGVRDDGCNPRYDEAFLLDAQPVDITGTGGCRGYDKDARTFARVVNEAAMHWLKRRDDAAAENAVTALVRFANADAFQVHGHQPSGCWAAVEAAATLIPAWYILREYPDVDKEERAAVDGWVSRVVERGRGDPNLNNHDALRRFNEAMLAVMGKDVASLRHAILWGVGFQLARMRDDGSLPLEAERGRMAIAYTNRTIAPMVMIAEIAAAQGIDVYGSAMDGKTIDDAIGFLIRAERDNAVIDSMRNLT